MLDSDLALLYGVETKQINQAVNRNKEKFSNSIVFKVEYKEICMRSQNVTASVNKRNKTKLPYAFTEEGIYMLATILKSKVAVNTTIQIIHAFTNMRHFINDNYDLIKRVTIDEYKLVEHDDKIKYLMDKFNEKKIPSQKIFFNGEIYDAYSLILELFNQARESLVIIDNYIDNSVLDVLKTYKLDITIISAMIDNNLIEKYNAQYQNIKFIKNNLFHDRFIIIDNNKLYILGASIKDAGKKCFGINEISDKEYLKKIIKMIA